MQKTPENPFLAAREEWNERYGSYVAAARHWRVMAMMAMTLALGGTGYALFQTSQVKLVPYIVEVDRLGTPVTAGFPSQIDQADARVVRAMLGGFVTAFKSVTPDAVVQKQYIDHTYALLRSTDPATEKINGWFRSANPFERARAGTVAVEVNTIVALSAQSYQIDWTEFERDRAGKQIGTKRFRGIATVTLSQPMDEATIRLNPIGLYLRDFDWTAQL